MQQHVKILIKGDVRILDAAPTHSYGFSHLHVSIVSSIKLNGARLKLMIHFHIYDFTFLIFGAASRKGIVHIYEV